MTSATIFVYAEAVTQNTYCYIKGDLTEDGIIDVDDVLCCLDLAFVEPNAKQLKFADFDGNNVIDVDDVLACLELCFVDVDTLDKVDHTYDDENDTECNVCGLIREVLCEHNETTILPAVEPTCTEPGLTDGTHCLICSEVIVAQQVIDANGHTEIADGAVAPSCSKWGATGHVVCETCHITITEQTFIAPLGHNYVDGICSNCDKEEVDYSDVSLYKSYEGYAFFDTDVSGEAMRALYDEMEAALTEFHHSSTQNAELFVDKTDDEDLYLVGMFDYSKYNLSIEQAQTVYSVFRKDHPAFYWMSYWLYWSGQNIYITTVKEYSIGTDRAYYNELLYQTIEEYTALTDGETSAYTIALTYYEAIINNNEYAYTSNWAPEQAQWAHSVMGGVLYNRFVCEGYAKLFQMLLNFSQVENMYVTGDAGGSHVWNLVRMDDGNWYWFDPTWGDSVYVDYYYFCTIDSMLTTHTPVPSNTYGMYFNVTLPDRATTFFSSDDILEIDEIFTIGDSTYCLWSSGTVRLISGPNTFNNKLVYNGVVYDVIY